MPQPLIQELSAIRLGGMSLKMLHARHHYDIDVAIYRLFLAEGLNYSCAFLEDPPNRRWGKLAAGELAANPASITIDLTRSTAPSHSRDRLRRRSSILG